MDAGLDLELVVPHGEIEERVKLVRAESLSILLHSQESAVMAVLTHVDALLLKVKLVSHDLQNLCEVLHTVRSRFDVRLFDSVGCDDDGASDIDLTSLHFGNSLSEDDTDLLSVEEVSVC